VRVQFQERIDDRRVELLAAQPGDLGERDDAAAERDLSSLLTRCG
jgi:hypothetical protein